MQMTQIKKLLDRATIPELQDYQAQIAKRIKALQAKDKRAKIQEIKRLAQESGISIRINSGNVGKSAARYVNPENGDQTWTGRGRKPKWVVQYLADGNSLDDLEI